MWNPFAGMIDRWRAHPWQQATSTVAGFLLPGGNVGANQIFNWYNNGQFNGAAQQSIGNLADLASGVNWSTPDYGMNNDPGAGLQGPSGSIQRAPGGPTMDFGPGIGAGYNPIQMTPGMGYNMTSPGFTTMPSWNQSNPNGLLDFLGSGGPQQQQAAYLNSPQAGGNLGLGMSSGGLVGGFGHGFGNNFGYSQAGGGSGAGTWAGGGGMHSYQVNSGSLSPSNYGGIAHGRGRENGVHPN